MVLTDRQDHDTTRDLDVLFREARRRRRRRRLAALAVVVVVALVTWAAIDGDRSGPPRSARFVGHSGRPAATRPAKARRSLTRAEDLRVTLTPGVPAFSTPDDGTVSLLESTSGAAPRFWAERTTDGGLQWSAGPPSADGDQAQFSVDRDFVTARDGWAWGHFDSDLSGDLYATTNGGRTWHVDLPGWFTQSVEVAPGGSTWIIAIHAHSVRASCFDHNTCPERLFETPGPAVAPFAVPTQPSLASITQLVHPSELEGEILDGSALEVTGDGGRHWSRRPLPHLARFVYNMPAAFVAIAADGPNVVWAEGWRPIGSMDGSEGQIVTFVSDDAGQTWQRRTPPHPGISSDPFDAGSNNPYGASLLQVVSPSVAWYVAFDDEDGDSIWRTSDGGRRWNEVFRAEQPDQTVLQPVDLDATSATTAVLSATDTVKAQILRTTDGGRTWHHAKLSTPAGRR